MTTQAPRVGGRQCPVAHSCTGYVRPGQLMCAPHWRDVPKDTQAAVWQAWRRFQKTSDDADWDIYAQARQDALDAAQRSTDHA